MRLEDLSKASVPVTYALLIIGLATERGIRREELLKDLNIPARLLETPESRLSILQTSHLLYRAMKLSREPAFGYEIGLNSNLTSHGFVGFGLLSHSTLREAIEFGAKFIQLRTPFLSVQLIEEGHQGVIEVAGRVPFGPVRQCTFDLFLVGLWRMVRPLTGGQLNDKSGIELWFDYPEPEYYARYRERLPTARFSKSSNQLRFPVEYLDRTLNMANTDSAQLIAQQCERELTLLGYTGDFLSRVRAVVINDKRSYPGLETAATKLHVSSRTLKRRLREHGVSYQALLDEVRKRDSIRLLEDGTLTVVEVASRIGFTDPANFTRAFRKWTGVSPSDYRTCSKR